MKLADRIAAHNERMIEIYSDVLSSEKSKAKDLFRVLDGDYESVRSGNGYGDEAKSILKKVAENADGFAKDIANKYLTSIYKMSEKQAWCVAFAYEKISKINK